MKLFALFLLLPAVAPCVTVETWRGVAEICEVVLVEGRKPGFSVEVR